MTTRNILVPPEVQRLLDVVHTILLEAELLPDQTGLLSKGEIGIAALQLFDIYRTLKELIAEAMSEDDPKAALRELGAQVRARTKHISYGKSN